MKRCRNCVLPESAPGISFNPEGTCNYCVSYREPKMWGLPVLQEILDSNRERNGKYDCLVAVSGGRDSCFALLKLVKDLGRNVLAVNYRNPFTHPQAWANVQKAVEALGVDLVTYNLKNRLHERTLRDNLKAWLRRPRLSMVNLLCLGCRTMDWMFERIAREHDIRCIIGAGTPFEDTSFKKAVLEVEPEAGYEETIVRGRRVIMREIMKNPRYLNRGSVPLLLKGYWSALRGALPRRSSARRLLKMSIFYFLEWNEEEVLSRVESELGWERPAAMEGSWRFDCRVSCLKDYIYLKMMGMTEKDDFYSKLIRAGLISRKEALGRLEKENQLRPDEVQKLLCDLGLDAFAVDKFLQL